MHMIETVHDCYYGLVFALAVDDVLHGGFSSRIDAITYRCVSQYNLSRGIPGRRGNGVRDSLDEETHTPSYLIQPGSAESRDGVVFNDSPARSLIHDQQFTSRDQCSDETQ